MRVVDFGVLNIHISHKERARQKKQAKLNLRFKISAKRMKCTLNMGHMAYGIWHKSHNNAVDIYN